MDEYGPDSRVCHTIRGSINKVLELAPNNAVFVESGCYLGHTTKHFIEKLLATGKNFTYYCVDNWELSNVTERHADNLAFFKGTLGDLVKYVTIISSDSLEAVKQFEDNSVFYCFLDDCHDYPHVQKQIGLWLPKMSEYSILSGDDYNCGVEQAVKEYFLTEDVEEVYDGCGFLVMNPKDKAAAKIVSNYETKTETVEPQKWWKRIFNWGTK